MRIDNLSQTETGLKTVPLDHVTHSKQDYVLYTKLPSK